MKFTLRQARALESRLRNVHLINPVIPVRSYSKASALDDILEGTAALESDVECKLRTTEIRHSIRHMINVKNMECGVSELLNTRDMLNAKRDLLNTLIAPDDAKRQVDAMDTNAAISMANIVSEDVSASVGADLDSIGLEMQDISSKLATLNSSVCVELGLEDTVFLQTEGLI